jgi:prefoldin subunit 5
MDRKSERKARRYEMADEKEELLNKEIEDYEEELKSVAGKLQELAGVDCSFGACVFDPEMQDVEAKLAEIQRRKKVLSEVKESLDKCSTE